MPGLPQVRVYCQVQSIPALSLIVIFSLPGKKSKKREPDDLKKEVELDVHTVTVAELADRFRTDVVSGLTTKQAQTANVEYGLNQLTPPPTTPEWVKFMKNLFTGFSMLLWAAAILSFMAFGLEHVSSHGDPEMDNLYLGCILVFVVTVTAIFSYYQEAKSSSVMESFKNLVPKTALVRRNGEVMTIMAREVSN